MIGSVLLSRPTPYSEAEEQRIRESVSQAAPVLANLRNLAIAEIRAATDGLTGLPNKRAVTDTLKRMFAQAATTRSPLALLLLDLDHFKQVNDQHGHPVGDQVLANVGAALRGVLRNRDFAGRNGGEEFAILLPDTEIAAALEIAERVRAAIAEISLPGIDVVGHGLGRRGRLPRATRAPWTGSSDSPTRRCTWPSGRAVTASSWPSRAPPTPSLINPGRRPDDPVRCRYRCPGTPARYPLTGSALAAVPRAMRSRAARAASQTSVKRVVSGDRPSRNRSGVR